MPMERSLIRIDLILTSLGRDRVSRMQAEENYGSASNRSTFMSPRFPCDPLCPLWLKFLTFSPNTTDHADRNATFNANFFRRTTQDGHELFSSPESGPSAGPRTIAGRCAE